MKHHNPLTVFLLLACMIDPFNTSAQDSEKAEEKPKKWFETMKISGYAQVRYNRLLETNSDLECDQCDKSIGNNNSIFIRRARIIFSGKLHDRVYFYFQPDFASNVASDKQHFLQVRDLYFDVFLDKDEVYRLRIGQSKVPFGYDNLQSSSRRLNLDRSDPINSAAPNERDLGFYFYYTPKWAQERFKKVYTSVLKGTGNYGLFGIGVYNGQSANVAEENNSMHIVARTAIPFEVNERNFEVAFQGYTGKFVLFKGIESSRGLEFTDRRVAASFTMFPQPFGFQAEYTVGEGPRFQGAYTGSEGTIFDPVNSSVQLKHLQGGYAMASYALKKGSQNIIPFARVQYYDGGKKHEDDARSYTVYETEFGIEWQPVPSFEATVAYNVSDRRYEDFTHPINRQKGNFLRIQAQVNF